MEENTNTILTETTENNGAAMDPVNPEGSAASSDEKSGNLAENAMFGALGAAAAGGIIYGAVKLKGVVAERLGPDIKDRIQLAKEEAKLDAANRKLKKDNRKDHAEKRKAAHEAAKKLRQEQKEEKKQQKANQKAAKKAAKNPVENEETPAKTGE